MKFMIKATNLDLTPSIERFIEEKLGVLERFLKAFESEGEIELRVEIARTTRHHRHGDIYRAEANLRLPHQLLRAEHEDIDVRTAIDHLKPILRIEIDKYKTKHETRRAAKKGKRARSA